MCAERESKESIILMTDGIYIHMLYVEQSQIKEITSNVIALEGQSGPE